ncbi:hypothetical protein ACLEPN_23595 [Myxococcus sp. 1LA]
MEAPSALPCPRCQSPRAAGPECPRCGIIYAKADARAARQREESAPLAPVPPEEPPLNVDPAWLATPDLRSDVLPPETPSWDVDAEEAAFEHRLRTWAVPVALLVSFVVHRGNFGAFAARLITMPFHELGHAMTAWLCGRVALPTLWVTVIRDRSSLLAVLLAAALGVWAWWAWKRRLWLWVACAATLLSLQAVGTLMLPSQTVSMLITFGGDGGMMVLGAVMMLTFYAPAGSYLHKQALRWGFLGLGALSLVDGVLTWWDAKKDAAEIPFGRMEGVGLSDASKLVEAHRWGEDELIHRYLVVATLCLLVVAGAYVVHFVRGRARLAAATR